jgi:hypothetical protein
LSGIVMINMTKLFAKINRWIDSSAIVYVFLAALIVFAFLIGFYKIANADIWWHMKTGELILSHGIPTTDPYSFTAFGNHWVTHEWLAEVLFYLLYSLGGITMLMVFKGIMSVLIAYIIFDFGIKNNIIAPITAAVAMFTVAGMSYMLNARPHTFTFFFLAILAYHLFKKSESAKAFKTERWVVLPIIFLFWANIHAGFILGLAIYWVVVGREIILAGKTKDKFNNRLKTYGLPAIFAAAVCLINPNTYEIFTYPIMISTNPIFKSTISEWVSPIYLGPNEWLAKSILYLASVLGLGTAIFHIKRRPDISLIVVAVGVSAWLAMRNIQNYVVVLAFAILAIPSLSTFKAKKISLYIKPTLAIVACIWMIVLFYLVRDYQRQNGKLGYGIAKDSVPVDAAAFLNETGFEGNILNILSDGGYLIWAGYPKWRVFVDGRLDVYGPVQIDNYRRVVEGGPGAFSILDQLNVGAALLPMPPNIGAIRNQLALNSQWALVYYDDYYLIYLKRNEINKPILDKWAYQVINPLASGYGLTDNSKINLYQNEAKRAIEINDNSALANAAYGYALQQKNEYLPAAEYYSKAISIRPGLLDFYRLVGRMYFNAKSLDSAEVWLLKAIAVKPKDPWAYYDLGLMYSTTGDYNLVEKYCGEALSIDPNSPAKQIMAQIRAIKQSNRPVNPPK